MISPRQALHGILAGTAGGAYLWLGHHSSVSDEPSIAGVLVGLAPMLAIAGTAAWHARRRSLAMAVWLSVCAAGALHLSFLRDHAAWLYFVQHFGAMSTLGISFAMTLGGTPAQALCSRVALMVHEQLDEDYLIYTWQVTAAWTIFFVSSAVLSLVLFFLAPVEWWSVFANIATPLLVGALFVGEYLVRLRRLPGRSHLDVASVVAAYSRYSRQQAKGR